MAKKIRFPLKLAEGAEVRTLEELREHFDLEAILEYYKNGKLLTWLEDRYLEGEAEAVQALDETAPDFQRRLCEVFRAEYTGGDVDLEAIERRQERLKRLRSITDEAEYIQNIDRVAFDQEDLADLLDEGEERIYLCGEHFTIPASRKGITYVGINNPTVHISGNVPEDTAELGIEFERVACDDQMQSIFKLGVTAPRNGRTGEDTKDNLPEKLLQHILSYEMKNFLVTEHYYLYCRIVGKDLRWFRYEISTGQEVELPKEIANVFARKVDSEKLAYHCCDRIDDLFTVSGDQLAYCQCPGYLCSIDLNMLTTQAYKNVHFYEYQYAFSGRFFAVLLWDKTYQTMTVEVYGHHKTLQRIHKIFLSKSGEILLDGNAISNTEFEAIEWGNCEKDTFRSMRIFDNILCFILRTKSGRVPWIACIDLETKKCKLLPLSKDFYDIRFVAKTRQIVYIESDDYREKSEARRFPHIVLAISLDDGTFKQVFRYYTSDPSDKRRNILSKSDQYAIFADYRKDGNFHVYAIEFETQKTKLLPYIVSGPSIAALRKNRCLLTGDTFYCFRYKDYPGSLLDEVSGDGIACKFDLTEDSPQLIELDS